MIQESSTSNQEQNGLQHPPTLLASSSPETISKLTKISTVDIYKLIKGQESFIVKAFKAMFKDNYLKQKDILSKLQHKNIVKMVEIIEENTSSALARFKKFDIIITKEAKYGDMFNFITEIDPLNESISKMFIKQIASTMAYSIEKQAFHPNFLIENLLLNHEREIIICGWSGATKLQSIKPTQKDLVFALGEISICLMIATMPFSTKDPHRDPYFKFVNPTHIVKFWELLEKSVKRKIKTFSFSKSFKLFVQDIFFGKLSTFKDILESQWLKEEQISNQTTKMQLDAIQNQFQKKKSEKQQKRKENENLRRQIIEQELEMPTLQRLDSRSSEIQRFIQDCNFCKYDQEELNQISVEDSEFEDFNELFDEKIKYTVAHIKQILRAQVSNPTFFPGSEYQLKSFKVGAENKEIQIEISLKDLKEEEVEDEYITVSISLCKYKDKKLGKISIGESTLHPFFEKNILKCISTPIFCNDSSQ